MTRNELGLARVRRVQVSVVPQRHEQHISQARQGFFARDASQGPRAGQLWSQRNRDSPLITGLSAATSGATTTARAPMSTWPWSAVMPSAAPSGSTDKIWETRLSAKPNSAP